MIGVVLGLGFQWWPELHEPWQVIAFVFVYLDIVDYWIDYGPSLKKFPPKREVDVLLDVGIMFALFLYIYTTQLTLTYFFSAFILLRLLDFFWLLSSKYEYHPTRTDGLYLHTWLRLDAIECVITSCFLGAAVYQIASSLKLLLVFIAVRIIVRVLASLQYKKIHFS